MIKLKEEIRMITLNHTGIVEYRVTNPSRKAAITKIGISPIMHFIPSLAPLFKDSILLKVPGNTRLFPKISPAAPAMIREDISRVPWIQITNTDFHPRPLAKK
jgi:hypothetical protein